MKGVQPDVGALSLGDVGFAFWIKGFEASEGLIRAEGCRLAAYYEP